MGGHRRPSITEVYSRGWRICCRRSMRRRRSCGACNPAGFVFEAFGPLGEYRTEEVVYAGDAIVARHAIDTRVDDLKIGTSQTAASSVDELIAVVTSGEEVNGCVARHLSELLARLAQHRRTFRCAICTVSTITGHTIPISIRQMTR